MPSPKNRFIVASAGARKTQAIVDGALSVATDPVLITTYTNENVRVITDRIRQARGYVPKNITVLTWFSFLLRECCRPYQREITGAPLAIQGLDFATRPSRFIKKIDARRYYFNRGYQIYQDRAAELVCALNTATHGAVARRLERCFKHVFVDELQDLVGYDLDVLDLLLASDARVTAVGDPRQHTYSTNRGNRHHQYRGSGLLKWLDRRRDTCQVEERLDSYRCNAEICDLANKIFQDFPPMQSKMAELSGHDGIFMIPRSAVPEYYATYRPVVLRRTIRTDTLGLPAMNIGRSKGNTYDRVLIFPTKALQRFIGGDVRSDLDGREWHYVAVTRARYSVAFAVPD